MVAWAPVLRWELETAKPKLLVSVGKQADRFLTRLEREGLLPSLPERACIPHYSFIAMRPDRQGRPAGDQERESEYAAQFAQIAQRARQLRDDS